MFYPGHAHSPCQYPMLNVDIADDSLAASAYSVQRLVC